VTPRSNASHDGRRNRIYTEASDDEAYFAIPGAQVRAIEEKLTVIVEANQKLEEFHRARAASVPTG
jgi:uncharacterized protein (DUF169 family)